jgi:hypothetical protein
MILSGIVLLIRLHLSINFIFAKEYPPETIKTLRWWVITSACLIFFKWLDKADVPGDIRVYKRQNPDILCIHLLPWFKSVYKYIFNAGKQKNGTRF